MSLLPAAKRRRVDAASALLKPFKSPLKRDTPPATTTTSTPAVAASLSVSVSVSGSGSASEGTSARPLPQDTSNTRWASGGASDPPLTSGVSTDNDRASETPTSTAPASASASTPTAASISTSTTTGSEPTDPATNGICSSKSTKRENDPDSCSANAPDAKVSSAVPQHSATGSASHDSPTRASHDSTATPATHDRSNPADTDSLRDLQRQQLALQTQLARQRAELDTLSQAARIERSSRDAELERLVGVWRQAARGAAEELYAGVRDRVHAMGGVKAWQERERERHDRWRSDWETPSDRPGREGADQDEDAEGLDSRDDIDQVHHDEEGSETTSVSLTLDTEDQGFTMAMMLRSLNIDPQVIGYEVDGDRWAD